MAAQEGQLNPPAVDARRASPAPEERSVGELISELSRETSTLVRKEVALAKAEMSQKIDKATNNLLYVAAGGGVLLVGALCLVYALVWLLAWLLGSLALAALLVGLVLVAGGYFLMQKGLNALREMDMMPRETMESLRDDKEWLQEQTQ